MKKKTKIIIGISIIVGIIIIAVSLFLCFYPYFMGTSGPYKEYRLSYDSFDTFKQEYDKYYEKYIKKTGAKDEHIDLKKYEFEDILSCTYEIWGICGCKESHKTPNEECKTLRYVEAHMHIQIDEENSISALYVFSKQIPEKYTTYTSADYQKENGEWKSMMYAYGYVVADENYKSPVLTYIYNKDLINRYEKEEELLKLAEEWNPKILAEVNRKLNPTS